MYYRKNKCENLNNILINIKEFEMKKKLMFFSVFLIILNSIYPLTIKIGSIAPARSPWDKALREMAREWKKISKGKISIKIYPGGIAGSEKATIRKMKIGSLGGAVLSNIGITSIYPDFFVLSVPLLIQSEKELNYVTGKMDHYFKKKIEERGYKVIIWSMGGWLHFFSKKPIFTPDDLKKQKLSFFTGEPKMEQSWTRSGYQVIPNEIKDLMMALQTDMVNAFYLPPLVAASGQFFALAPNMASIKVAPLYGGIVFTKKIWEKIPDNIKDELLKSCRKISLTLNQKTRKLEKDAIKAMVKNGLKINIINKTLKKKWFAEAEKNVNYLIGKVLSREIYQKTEKYLKEFRKNNQ